LDSRQNIKGAYVGIRAQPRPDFRCDLTFYCGKLVLEICSPSKSIREAGLNSLFIVAPHLKLCDSQLVPVFSCRALALTYLQFPLGVFTYEATYAADFSPHATDLFQIAPNARCPYTQVSVFAFTPPTICFKPS
jgi:hypothetical protein